jgi:uncharacterized protein YlxW (UPF0749 family)
MNRSVLTFIFLIIAAGAAGIAAWAYTEKERISGDLMVAVTARSAAEEAARTAQSAAAQLEQRISDLEAAAQRAQAELAEARQQAESRIAELQRELDQAKAELEAERSRPSPAQAPQNLQ